MRTALAIIAITIVAAVAWGQTLPAISQSGTLTAGATPAAATDSVFQFYATNLRASLFSGFLTLGSFLVAVNTFVIVNVKKEVYDNPQYRKKVAQARSQNGVASYYGPLKRMSGLLFLTILLALATAISQLTVGILIQNRFAAAFCVLIAGVTMAVLIFALFQTRNNLKDWFALWEEIAESEEGAGEG